MLSGTETWPGMMGTDDVSTPDDPTNLSSVSGWSAGKLRACRRFMGLQIHQTSLLSITFFLAVIVRCHLNNQV